MVAYEDFMKKQFSSIYIIILVSTILFSNLFASCASTSASSSNFPTWFPDYRTAFPDSRYIAQQGRADTEETAKTEAVAQIARYFKTSVNANLKTSIQNVTSGENVSETTSIINDVDLMSKVELFAVETTAPYYFKKEKKWYSVAYIEREKAWNQYQPTVENAKSKFYAMKKNAENESDPFLKAVSYAKALQSGKEFLEKLEYARILDPQKEAAYSENRKAVSEIPALIASEQEKCTVYLSVSGDYGNIISSSLTQTFSKNGFKLAKSADRANYTAYATVESNASGSDPISIYPSLEVKITSKNGKTVFANQTKVEKKTISYTLENAQKKAFPILAEESDKSISRELCEIFGN